MHSSHTDYASCAVPGISVPTLIIYSHTRIILLAHVSLCNATQRNAKQCSFVCSCNNRVNNLVERTVGERKRGGRRLGVGVFHRDLGIKYLHCSSFASVYTAKLANPKYSAFSPTRRRKTDGGRQGRAASAESGECE